VQLFNQGDFVCATTLAGAAEEVLGRIARKRAGTNALDCNRLRLLLFMYPLSPRAAGRIVGLVYMSGVVENACEV
jgi:hypothetical protein